MSNGKLLLISLLQGSHRNLSCLALFSFLRSHEVETDLLFLPKEEAYDEASVIRFIVSNRYTVVGLSVMTDMYYFARSLTQAIKREAPGVHVVWGGIHPSLKPEECLADADSICVGEAEATLLPLLARIAQRQTLADLPGVGVRTPDGGVVSHPPHLIEDLDTLPMMTYDWSRFFVQDADGLRPFTVADYKRYSNYGGEDYTLMATRSCPFSCAYCCNSYLNELYGTKGRIRKRSVGRVLEEIAHARRTIDGLQFINFIDDQFLTSKKWNDEFCARYKAEIGLPFIVRLTPSTFNENDLEKLQAAGLKYVQIGLQSGSERTNKTVFFRKFNRQAIVDCSRLLTRHGVFSFWDVIIQNDLEDDTDRRQTIELLLDLEKPFKCFFFALTPFPKTRLETVYQERGIVPRTNPYLKGYGDYDETDFYFQLATIIPYTSNTICRYFLEHAQDEHVRQVVAGYYRETKQTGDRKSSTAQKSEQASRSERDGAG